MSSPGELKFYGTAIPVAQPINLKAGWNWIGYYGQNSLPITQALVSIAGQYNRVLSEDQYYDAGNPDFSSLQDLSPNQGYLLHSKINQTLVYPASVGQVLRKTSSDLCQKIVTEKYTNLFSRVARTGPFDTSDSLTVKFLTPRGVVAGCGLIEDSKLKISRIFGEETINNRIYPGLKNGEPIRAEIINNRTRQSLGIFSANFNYSPDTEAHEIQIVTSTSPTPTSSPTTNCTVTKTGDEYLASFSGATSARLWITRKDGGMIGNSSLGLGSTKTYNNAPPNYLIVGRCDGGCGASIRQTVTGLAPGDYYVSCGIDTPTANICNGNPFCDYEKSANPSLPGGLPCPGNRSCGSSDNLAFTITSEFSGCRVTKTGDNYTAFFSNATSGRLWLTRKDGGIIGNSSLGLGSTRSYNNSPPNYLYLGNCTNGCANGISQTITGLGVGEYYLHCDISSPSPALCSGNPFCDYKKALNPSLPGGLPCAGYRSCHSSDNLLFNITN